MKDVYSTSRRKLLRGFFLNFLFSLIEFLTAFLTNSIALLADALHDLGDASFLLLSWVSGKLALKAPTKRKTWGYHRATILSAFFNGIALLLITFFIFYKAYERLQNPREIIGLPLILLSFFGIALNGLAVWNLRGSKDIVVKSGFYHLLEDFLGWIGILAVGLVSSFTHLYVIDPLITFGIGLLVLKGAAEIVSYSFHLLMEGAPLEIDIGKLESDIKKIKGVKDLHDIHVWALGSRYYAFSAHVVVDDMKVSETRNILRKIKEVLKKKYNVIHPVIQFECKKCRWKIMH